MLFKTQSSTSIEIKYHASYSYWVQRKTYALYQILLHRNDGLHQYKISCSLLYFTAIKLIFWCYNISISNAKRQTHFENTTKRKCMRLVFFKLCPISCCQSRIIIRCLNINSNTTIYMFRLSNFLSLHFFSIWL